MDDNKVKIEQNGKTEEVSKEKLEEMQGNPDFQITEQEDGTHKVQQRLMD
jgi:hypothetical protein